MRPGHPPRFEKEVGTIFLRSCGARASFRHSVGSPPSIMLLVKLRWRWRHLSIYFPWISTFVVKYKVLNQSELTCVSERFVEAWPDPTATLGN